ncbi:family 20 glycosylhydrolase, partial [Pelagibacteraceae bacterium]|nr:family 20 glycosylhydrolase [Pelagibacteraceae bacterium]
MLFQINPSFTKKNQLKLNLSKNFVNQNFKLCFSLVYSIQSIDGAEIINQTGRYYELIIKKNTVLIDLQIPRIGSYNMSCGPEGTFIIDDKNNYIKAEVSDLKFENKIAEVKYDQSTVDDYIPIVPEPTKYIFKKDFIEINDKTFKIVNDNTIIKNIINYTERLELTFSNDKGFPIHFIVNNYIEDEYSLEISKDKIEIFHKNYGGKFYGIISLIQLIDFYKNKLPICTIHDNPKYQWRGMHLDCARQFYTMGEIKRLFDYMAFFKLNRFHWHLTDNEAWRIEIKKYPDLALNGGYRGYNFKIPPLYGSGYDKYGGYYSQEDIKDLIIYAQKLNIEIMPEIDLPAHSWALLEIMPELRDQSSNIVSEDVGSYKNNTINPSLEKTVTFLKDMLNEVSAIFSYDVIHVGVDERPSNA